MVHPFLPQLMTPENLADYIRANRVSTQNHTEKFPLTDEEKNELAMKSSLASRTIKKLEDLLKYITTLIKKGTPMDVWVENELDHAPVDVKIPPTAGIDVLKANRLYADDQIEKGYREEITTIYFIPWPEYERMLAVDIEGKEWSVYTKPMTRDEIKQHGKPILRAGQEVKDLMEEQGIKVEKIDGNEVTLTAIKKSNKKGKLDTMPPLSEEENLELNRPEDKEEDLNL